MKRNDSEFKALQRFFERSAIKASEIRGIFDKEPDNVPNFYQDGNIDIAFKMFMSGYEYAKSITGKRTPVFMDNDVIDFE